MFAMNREKISSFALRGFHRPKFEGCSKKECFNNSPALREEVFSKYFPEISEADSEADSEANSGANLEVITYRLNECSSRWNLRRYSYQTESVDLQCSINIQ